MTYEMVFFRPAWLILLIASLALSAACATSGNSTERVLREYGGRNISDFFAEKKYYPDSTIDLPNGGKVYAFTVGSGARVDQSGNVRSNVCRVWMETDAAGVIVRWRYENCS
ncbi:MAG TPA: hypothetical protein VIF83_06185 [Gemmatimonadaceae bacterium]|jgi:hypothetical protein